MDRLQHAQAVAQSSLIPDGYRNQPANVLWAMDLADALGIPFPQVMQTMVVMRGRMAMSADIMAAVVRRAGHKLRVREQGMSVTAALIRQDDPDYEFSATWDEAKARQAGLWGQRGPWTQYPAQMLRSRAITEVCRQGASDALAGTVYSPEELEPAESNHNAADAEAAAAARHASAAAAASAQADPALDKARDRSRALLANHVKQHGGTLADVWRAAQDMGADPDDPDSVAACLAALPAAQEADGD
jgi:hypothetical protein